MATRRASADQRRAQAVTAGLAAFADHGLTTAAISRVATEMHVSQPYVFRLFGSKQAFFLACLDEVESRVNSSFDRAAREHPGAPVEPMGAAFRALVADGVLSGFFLQACALARHDATVSRRCRSLISSALRTVARHGRMDGTELATFLGRGALVVILQALGVDLAGGSGLGVETLLAAEAGT